MLLSTIIRELQIKLAKKSGTFEAPERIAKGVVRQPAYLTIAEFLAEYVEAYGLKKWGNSFYTSNKGLIDKYIIPNIGSRFVSSFTVRDMDEFYTQLLEQPAVDELRSVRVQQEEYKRQLGEEYRDYDLVIAQINGHPYEKSIIARQFKRFIADIADPSSFSPDKGAGW